MLTFVNIWMFQFRSQWSKVMKERYVLYNHSSDTFLEYRANWNNKPPHHLSYSWGNEFKPSTLRLVRNDSDEWRFTLYEQSVTTNERVFAGTCRWRDSAVGLKLFLGGMDVSSMITFIPIDCSDELNYIDAMGWYDMMEHINSFFFQHEIHW